MEMTQCSIGHFYDSDEYSTCPFCSSSMPRLDFDTESNFDKMAFQREFEKRKSQAQTAGVFSQSGRAVFSSSPASASQEKCVVGWLVILDGANRGKSFELFEGKNTIGRSSQNLVCLTNDSHVSRMAASVVYDSRSCTFFCVPDPGASCVTSINDQPLMNHSLLQKKDIISIGKTKLMFIPFCSRDFHW